MDEPIALGPGDGNTVKADRPELSLLEITFDPGSGVDPHFHKGHSDSFYVLEGELEFHVGDEVLHATEGSYVLAPPNVVHWFRNVGSRPARMLNLHTPGGFVQYRRELRRAARAGNRAGRGVLRAPRRLRRPTFLTPGLLTSGVLREPASRLAIAVHADVPATLEDDLEVAPIDRVLRPPAVDDPPLVAHEVHELAVHDPWRSSRPRLDESRTGRVQAS